MSEPTWTPPGIEGLGLPDSVRELIEFTPLEDVGLAIIRHYIPDVPCFSLVPQIVPDGPFILVRRDPTVGEWTGRERFIDAGNLEIQVYAPNPEGDERAALVSEAVRAAMARASTANFHIPGVGWVIKIQLQSEPSRSPDWVTSSGPVQYADLPEGYWRYESRYSVSIRRQLS